MTGKTSAPQLTKTQGQYLAFIYCYCKLHRTSPSEAEIGKYFRVAPPSVHQMILKLEEKGVLARQPGVARSLRVLVPRNEIPELDDDGIDDQVPRGKFPKIIKRVGAAPPQDVDQDEEPD